MKINPIQNTQQNFGGRYRTLIKADEYQRFCDSYAEILDNFFDTNIAFFWGKDPMKYKAAAALEEYALKNNANYNWAIKNLRNKGVKYSEGDYNTLWLASGTDDAYKLSHFMLKEEKLFDLRDNINLIREFISDINAPQDVLELKSAIRTTQESSNRFAKFLKENPYEKVYSIEEMVKKVLGIINPMF